jgi:hypothetical protein
MKKILLMLAVIGLLSFAADKYITIKFTEAQIGFHWKNLENVKKLIDESNLPHAQVKFIIASIDSLQKDITKSAKIDTIVIRKK